MTKRCTIRELKLLLESGEAVEEAQGWEGLQRQAEGARADMQTMG